MNDNFESIQSQAIKYAMDMHRQANGNNNRGDFNHFNKSNSRSLTGGNDFTLIFAIILLLTSDGADMPLLLALVYILT